MSDGFGYGIGVRSPSEPLELVGYHIQHAIGSGAGGQVYKATQRSTGQAVAVKVLSLAGTEGHAQMRRIERFRREIAFCSSLYHPDIVRLLDSGVLSDGNRFAVFEFIPGCTLADLLRDEGMLKVERTRSILAQVLPPLAYAHAKGIAHRDLKPGNVMVTTDGGRDRVKLLDFGISTSTNPQDQEELARLTQSHEWLGTPLYAAPEQLRGESTGHKSDLYAWALVFVECLTGKALISGKTLPEIIRQHSRPEPHVLPTALVSHRLGALLLRLLEKDLGRRLGEAQLVQSLLERIALDGLQDPQGYLREAAPVSGQYRLIERFGSTVTDAEPPPRTEQRHLTALCCRVSLVGSGALSSEEQVDALLDDSYSLVSEVLRQFGATAAHSVGGYSLWYFGVTQMRDADARLALRSALEVIHRMDTLPRWFAETGLTWAAEIGIHAGPVTVQLSSDDRKPLDGVTARVAVELASLQEQGATQLHHRVLLSSDFRQLVARHADLDEDAVLKLALPWRETPLSAYRLKGEARSASLKSDRAPFVGRVSELNALLGAWRKTTAGEGAACLLRGEAGVGKSRLAGELLEQLEQEGCHKVEMRCLPEWQNAFLRPLQFLFSDLLGVHASAQSGPDVLERKLSEAGLLAAVTVPLFCSWLSLPLPGGCAPLGFSPQKQRQLLQSAIVDFLLATLERGGVLLVEDLHWADPSTLECLDALVAKLPARAGFALMTMRPERELTWTTAVPVVTLLGLTSEFAMELASSLAPDAGPALSGMVERSDGIPLYLEELSIYLRALRGGAVKHDEAWEQAVPPSLRSLLASRLEALTHGRETAQFAAAIGREFSLDLLIAVLPSDEYAVLGDLEELVTAQIVTKRLRLGGPVYGFRHALIRDTAYDATPADIRKRNHRLIAEGYERHLTTIAEAQPDTLAHHYERAGLHAKAIHFWELAAQKSNSASAHSEAITQIDRAIGLLGDLGTDGVGSRLTEARLKLTRGSIVVSKRGYTDPDASASFERVLELTVDRHDALPITFAARWGIWYSNNTRCNFAASVQQADELLALAKRSADSSMLISAWAATCQSRFCTGRFDESVDASRKCAAEYELSRHRGLALRYGDDPRVSGGSFEALAELIRGNHDVAVARVNELMHLIDELGFPALRAGMHGQAAWLFLNWGGAGAENASYDLALHHAQAAVDISQQHGFKFWELYGRLNLSAARIASGDGSAALELLRYSEMWCSSGARLGRCWHLAFAARGLHLTGSYVEARRTFDEALSFCATHDARYFESEIRRQRAVLIDDPHNPNRDQELAAAEWAKGAADARRLGAGWWELSNLLTGMRASDAGRSDNRRHLEQLVGSWPSMDHEPPLLKEARALVELK